MLGLVFIYFIGRAFYNLAGDYNKNEWGYAILGVASYYGAFFGSLFLIGAGIGLFADKMIIDERDDLMFSLMGIPIGLLSCYLTYRHLSKRWEREERQEMSVIDEIGRGE